MIIRHLSLKPAALVDAEPFRDHRGVFARLFCVRELDAILSGRAVVNVNLSHTRRAGGIRGLHFQRAPFMEMKLVRCTRGAFFDVIVDLRRESPTFLRWHGEILSAENMRMMCVPEGFAHGFQTLEDDSEALYLTTAFHAPESEGGVRYDDPVVGVRWPLKATDISEKDGSHPLLGEDSNPLEEA